MRFSGCSRARKSPRSKTSSPETRNRPDFTNRVKVGAVRCTSPAYAGNPSYLVGGPGFGAICYHPLAKPRPQTMPIT